MKVYIIHGYNATPDDHWFLWIKNELIKLNITTEIISLPTPMDPKPKEWQQALKEQIKYIDKNSYFITHSLGSITLLQYLQNQNVEQIAGYILVSPFNESLPDLKQLDSFLKPDLEYDKLKNMTTNRTVISAKDDQIVPIDLSKSLALSLDADFIEIEKGGHFLASDGFKKFPLLLKEVKRII